MMDLNGKLQEDMTLPSLVIDDVSECTKPVVIRAKSCRFEDIVLRSGSQKQRETSVRIELTECTLRNLCLDGVYIHSINLTSCTVKNVLIIQNCIIENDLIIDTLSCEEKLTGLAIRRNSIVGTFTLKDIGVYLAGTNNCVSFRENNFSDVRITGSMHPSVDFGKSRFEKPVHMGNELTLDAYNIRLPGKAQELHLEELDKLGFDVETMFIDDKGDVEKNQKVHFLTPLSFCNCVFKESLWCNDSIFEGFVDFYNTQFYAEAHFDNCTFKSGAYLETCYAASELTFQNASIEGVLWLDYSIVDSRIDMTRARFDPDKGFLSIYNIVTDRFEIEQYQLERSHQGDKLSVLWRENVYRYSKLKNKASPRSLRMRRVLDVIGEPGQKKSPDTMVHKILDELNVKHRNRKLTRSLEREWVTLRNSFNERVMHVEEDWALWKVMHYKTLAQIGQRIEDRHNGLMGRVSAFPIYLKQIVFEKGFGWGIQLQNLIPLALTTVLLFAVLYAIPIWGSASVIIDGDVTTMNELSLKSFYLSLQALFGILLGDWAPVGSGPIKIFITIEGIIGILITTFLVGAYTRKILR